MTMTSQDLQTRLGGIKLLVLDVDGVLTDGRVTYGDEIEWQAFNVKDGLGLNLLQRGGLYVAWITGRGCVATERRAAELGITELHMHAKNKLEIMLDIQERLDVRSDETVVMGDDLPDLRMRPAAGVLACPADAASEVLVTADWISTRNGGQGAVRDVCEAILKAQSLWAALVVDVTT